MAEDQLDLMHDAPIPDDALEHLADVPADVRRKWPKDLATTLDIFAARLGRMGYATAEAQKISHALVLEQAAYCGGRYFYLPKGDVLERAIRDHNLYRDWSDRHLMPDQLAAKYRITVQHVYRVIKEQRGYHLAKVQPTLF